MRIERVFELTSADGKYQNIKIAVDGDNKIDIFKEIYLTLYMDRMINALLAGNDVQMFHNILIKVNEAIEILKIMDVFGKNTEDVEEALTSLDTEDLISDTVLDEQNSESNSENK